MRLRLQLIPSLILLALLAGFLRLGFWQLDREQQKRDLVAAFNNAASTAWLEVNAETPRFTRVRGQGRFDTRSVLLDNQTRNGRPGVHVYTPFRFDDGRWLLVNRGWQPMAADRRSLPVFDTPAGVINITGILNLPPQVGRQLGEALPLDAQNWPNLVTYLDLGHVETALGVPLDARVLQLSPDSPAGFEGRDWSPVNFGPDKHRAYAIQWFALALTVAVVLVIINTRRGNSRRGNARGKANTKDS